jgi:hypothetical protein
VNMEGYGHLELLLSLGGRKSSFERLGLPKLTVAFLG